MSLFSFEISNCYGINNLIKEFDFSGGKSTHLIYAPNGGMKSSFANVFDDYSKDESRDLIFSERFYLSSENKPAKTKTRIEVSS